MSEFMKNLRSLFIAEAEEGKDDKTSTNKKEEEAKPSITQDSQESTTNIALEELDGKVSAKFTKILLEAIEKYNEEGFDYLEYKNGIRSLAKMDMDEATRFKSAFAMAQTMGAQSGTLIKSAEHYLQVLGKERDKFESAAQQQIKSKVEDKKREIVIKEKAIEEKTAMIRRLENEVADLRKVVSKAGDSMESEEKKVNKTRADFIASYNNLFNQISADIDKMKNYLK